MKFKSLIVILITAIVGCDNNELIPRTNPRFSVTFIQELSENGAEFQAEMYDFGSDEIVEHGFVFSDLSNPRIGYADMVSEAGKPSEQFVLDANFGMIKGRTYYVAAFIRTENGYVYSSDLEFVSQGSEGFIFERIEIPDLVYLGDTVTVFGRNHSQLPNNTKIYVNDLFANVVAIDEEKIKFLIPRGIRIDRIDSERVQLDILMNFSQKQLNLTEAVRFKEPEFFSSEIQYVVYDQEVKILGKWMYSDVVAVSLRKDDMNYGLPVSYFQENEIRFYARLLNGLEDFDLVLTFRNKEYVMSGVFEMLGSELDPNQKYEGFTYDYYEVKGQNFIEGSGLNLFVSDNSEINASSEYSNNNVAGLSFSGLNLTRTVKVYANNYGKKSKEFAEFTFKDAALRQFKLPDVFNSYQEIEEGSVTVDGKGYFFQKRNVYRVDPVSKSTQVVATAPSFVINLAGVFSYAASNEKVYLGAIGGNNNRSFWEFDPNTNRLKQLADSPSKVSKQKLVYDGLNGSIYIEGGYGYGPNGVIFETGVYRYDINKNVWETLERKYDNFENTNLFKTFRYHGEVYSVVHEGDFIENKLRKFDSASQDWNVIENLGFTPSMTNSNEYFVLGDWVYGFSSNQIMRFNIETKEFKIWGPLYDFYYYSYNHAFHTSDKIYMERFGYLYEFDPEYFDAGLPF